MSRTPVKKSLLALAAVCLAFAPAAPAFAGGGHHGGGHHGGGHHDGGHHGGGHHDGGHHGGHHGGGHYGYGGYGYGGSGYGGSGYGHGGYGYSSHDYYYGSYGYRHHGGHRGRHGDRHGGLSDGQAVLLAAGIIGGAILIDRAIENDRARDGYYSGGYDPGYDRGYGPAPSRDFSYRRDERTYDGDDNGFEDNRALEGELAGGEPASGARYNYGAAYNDCKAETRDAARDSGVLVALPARPRAIDPIDDGAGVRFTADVIATGVGGAQYRRVMTCEADKGGVRFLELS